MLLLDDGAVFADGTHAELLATEPRYAEVLAQTDAGGDLLVRAEGAS